MYSSTWHTSKTAYIPCFLLTQQIILFSLNATSVPDTRKAKHFLLALNRSFLQRAANVKTQGLHEKVQVKPVIIAEFNKQIRPLLPASSIIDL